MKKFIEVKQRGYKDCACACLLSIIKFYGGDVSYEELCILLKIDNNGTNAYNIINTAKSFGFDGYGIKGELENIDITFPCIVHTLNNNYYHFMVLYEINNNICTLMDPDKGIIKMNINDFRKIFLKTIIILYPIKKIIKSKGTYTFNKYLYNLLSKYKTQIINIIVLSIVLVILTLINNFYLKILLEKYLSFNKLLIISVLFLDILIVKNIISFVRNRCLIHFNNEINIKLNKDIISHIFNLPYLFFKNKSTGEVMCRINDLNSFKNIISEIISGLFLDLIIIIFSLIIMFCVNSFLFYITILFSFIYLLIEVLFKNKFKYLINKYRNEYTSYNVMLANYINGYESIKNIDMVNNLCNDLFKEYNYCINTFELYSNYLSNQLFLKNTFVDLLYLTIMFLGSMFVYNNNLLLSNFILFFTILCFYIEPFKNVLSIVPRFYDCRDIYNRLNDILAIKSNLNDNSLEKIYGDVKISNLSYSYNGLDNVIENVNIDIKYCSNNLIVGESGAGKSTIFKILLKYLNDYDGNIIINNNNLIDIPNNIISRSFTYVSQNEYLINDTLRNNIIFFRDVSEEEYKNIIKICNLSDLIENSKLKDNQLIEDNGFNISGGQKQKIILARALLKNSNYIILDEALSEVSIFEEKLIISNIKKYFSNKTIIYSSHKNELVSEFDNVYYLERRGV